VRLVLTLRYDFTGAGTFSELSPQISTRKMLIDRKKAKIMRKVKFPFQLDISNIVSFCQISYLLTDV
jgi:hypothetical protein